MPITWRSVELRAAVPGGTPRRLYLKRIFLWPERTGQRERPFRGLRKLKTAGVRWLSLEESREAPVAMRPEDF